MRISTVFLVMFAVLPFGHILKDFDIMYVYGAISFQLICGYLLGMRVYNDKT